MYRSTKLFSGYSCCFRQWKATHSHCRFLHGYSVQFRIVFEGVLDDKNWVCDFGGFQKNGVKELLKHYFDHTTLVEQNDPNLKLFETLHAQGLIQIRILEHVSTEYFARFVWEEVSKLIAQDPSHQDRVSIYSVECIENPKNSAIYFGPA